MKHKVTFNCGEKTCRNENDEICRFVGNTFLCELFDNVELRTQNGRLIRCALCRCVAQADSASPGHDELLAACETLATIAAGIGECNIEYTEAEISYVKSALGKARDAIAKAKGIEA